MADQATDTMIGSFLLTLLPAPLDQDYRQLAGLAYPVPDRRTLKEQLERAKAVGEVVQRLTSLFEPEDFGIDTVQSALEKYHKRSRHLDFSGISFPKQDLQSLVDIISAGGLSFRDSNLVLRCRADTPGEVTVDCVCDMGGGGCAIDVYGNILKCRSSGCESGCGLVVTIPSNKLGGVVRL